MAGAHPWLIRSTNPMVGYSFLLFFCSCIPQDYNMCPNGTPPPSPPQRSQVPSDDWDTRTVVASDGEGSKSGDESPHWAPSMHKTEVLQEISCEYNKYIQFSLGGLPHLYTVDGVPFWVKYHKFGYDLQGVSADFAVG
ncbi:hypothetical protein C8R46DRAFT_1031011 [Mycena filopes]|nr:hypothetical protein C8R46DRAFT_1031011 [Mycena filopes]